MYVDHTTVNWWGDLGRSSSLLDVCRHTYKCFFILGRPACLTNATGPVPLDDLLD